MNIQLRDSNRYSHTPAQNYSNITKVKLRNWAKSSNAKTNFTQQREITARLLKKYFNETPKIIPRKIIKRSQTKGIPNELLRKEQNIINKSGSVAKFSDKSILV